MKSPGIHCADEVATYSVQTEVRVPFTNEKVWVLSRPVATHYGFLHRLALAWEVFTGKSDVLRWIRQ